MAEADQLLSAIVDSSDDAILSKDLNGTITSWNNGAERLFGYTAEEVIGKPVSILIPADRQDEEPMILDRIRRGSRMDHYETVRRRKDGKLLDISLTISPVRDAHGQIIGASKLARDITYRKHADQMQRLLAAIVESSDDAIASKDLNGILTSWNKGAETLFGYKAQEVIGKPVTILIPEDRIDEEPEILGRIRRGERIDHYETVRRRKDGSLVEVSLTVSPIKDDEGTVIGASKIVRDVTERNRIVRELQKARDELSHHAEDLENQVELRTAALREALSQLEEFSYSVSHDLRAPLRAIAGYADVFKRDYGKGLPPKAHVYLDKISRSAERMQRLVNDVLFISQVNRAAIDLHPVPLQRFIEEIVEQYPSMQPPAASVSIQTPHVAIADDASLGQAVSNLLANAVKFVAAGQKPVIAVRSEENDGRVRIWFEDSGIGIDPRHREKVFGMFQRLTTDSRYEGTGIGLAIVRKAVERMNGTVGVEPNQPVGSRFWVELKGGK